MQRRGQIVQPDLLLTEVHAAFGAATRRWSRPTKGSWRGLTLSKAPADTDGDGIPDAWEQSHHLNLNDPADATKLVAAGELAGGKTLEQTNFPTESPSVYWPTFLDPIDGLISTGETRIRSPCH